MSLVADVRTLLVLEWQTPGGISHVANVCPLSFLVRHDSGGMSLVADVDLLSVFEQQASGDISQVADVCLLIADVGLPSLDVIS